MNLIYFLFSRSQIRVLAWSLHTNRDEWLLHNSELFPDVLHIVHKSLAFSLASMGSGGKQGETAVLDRHGFTHIQLNWAERRHLAHSMRKNSKSFVTVDRVDDYVPA